MKGNLPAIAIHAKTLPEAWEKSVLGVWKQGIAVHTHYDKKDKQGNFIDPPSIEATVMVHVENPFNEPRIHKNFPGGPAELETYRQEVVLGIHNHWIEPGSTKWTYTYNERLTAYTPSEDLNAKDRGALISKNKLRDLLSKDPSLNEIKQALENKILDLSPINQINEVIKDLKRDITSKGAQATTWMPTADPGLESNRPCLQRLWVRPLAAEINGKEGYLLNLNTHWRSRDLYKGWFMNAYAITDFQRLIAERLEKEINMPVKVGCYIDISDSLHLYGAYTDSRTQEGKDFQEEIERMKKIPFQKRTWRSDNEGFSNATEEQVRLLAENPDYMKS